MSFKEDYRAELARQKAKQRSPQQWRPDEPMMSKSFKVMAGTVLVLTAIFFGGMACSGSGGAEWEPTGSEQQRVDDRPLADPFEERVRQCMTGGFSRWDCEQAALDSISGS